MNEAVVYAIAGQIGSGKTTFGRKLAAEKKALFFSIDQWIARLGVPIGSHEVYAQYYPGCQERIREVAIQALRLGVPVVFDFGVNSARGRRGLNEFAAKAGVALTIYHLSVPLEVCRARVHERNRLKPEGIHSFDFSDEGFDFVASNYEPPSREEGMKIIEVGNDVPRAGKTQVSLVAFEDFTDLDLFLMWDLLNRVQDPQWSVRVLSDNSQITSKSGLTIPVHGTLNEVSQSAVVVFMSGPGVRGKIADDSFLSSLALDPEKQLIGSMCSGALLLGALGLLRGKRATTYPTAVEKLKEFGAEPLEEPFVQNGNIATAAGCLAAQSLAGWIIERFFGAEAKDLVIKSIQPVGRGLSFSEKETEKKAASARILKGAEAIN